MNAAVGRVRRSTLLYAAVFCLAVVLYFFVRPEPVDPNRPARTEPVAATTTTTQPGF